MLKTANIPASPAGVVVDKTVSPSFTRGVEGITRKNESVLLILLSLMALRSGTESERDIERSAPFVYK